MIKKNHASRRLRQRRIDRQFFFSSRRRHTRSKRDWSSDVCSSDLAVSAFVMDYTNLQVQTPIAIGVFDIRNAAAARSEERRVGKECILWCLFQPVSYIQEANNYQPGARSAALTNSSVQLHELWLAF